jgi:hypothetical protein
MTRKEFLKTTIGGVTAAMFAWRSAGCKSSSSTTPPNPDDRAFSSSIVEGHSHSVTVRRTDVETPPANGVNYTSTSNSGHTHTVTLTQAQLQDLKNGTAVSVTDSLSSGHSHQYQITKWY